MTPDLLELTRLDVVEHLATSILSGCAGRRLRLGVGSRPRRRCARPSTACSPPPGAPADRDRPRLWIDRVFAPRGAGTVVTGTLTGGAVATDDALRIVRRDRTVRVRGIESAHRDARAGSGPGPGSRSTSWGSTTTTSLAATCSCAAASGRSDRASTCGCSRSPARRHGSRRRLAGRGRLGRAPGPGRASSTTPRSFARLRFDAPLPLAVGDRIVLRDPARARTIAGAEVLDVELVVPAPPRHPPPCARHCSRASWPVTAG